jgi:hypothetical protein
MPRFDFECPDGHITTLWDDDARFCAKCGNEYLKKVFVDAPNIRTKPIEKVDKLVRQALEEQGITNIQGGGHEGDREKITRKSTPEQLAAEKVLRDFPQLKDPNAQIQQQVAAKWAQVGAQGVISSGLSRIPGNQIGGGVVNMAKSQYPKDVRSGVRIRDPQNMQLTKKGDVWTKA